MDQCNPVGTIPTVDGTRPTLMTPWMASGSKSTNGRFTGRSREGDGAAPTLSGVARSEAAVEVEMQGRQPCDGGTGHHDDRGGGGLG
jgi:hypothetical protein